MKYFLVSSAFPLFLIINSLGFAAEGSFDRHKAALEAIREMANDICNKIPLSGSSQSAGLSGDLISSVNGLAKRLIGLGLSVTGHVDMSKYYGLLQVDLASAVKNNSECKLHVLEMLRQDLLIDNQTAYPCTRLHMTEVKARHIGQDVINIEKGVCADIEIDHGDFNDIGRDLFHREDNSGARQYQA